MKQAWGNRIIYTRNRMVKFLLFIVLLFLLLGCEKDIPDSPDTSPLLTLDDIKREFAIADSLNHLDDRSYLNFETTVLGIDSRNNQTIIRTPMDRGFGCILFQNYFTILYLNCDSVCCENNGVWIIDHFGFAGFPKSVGCAPDTVRTDFGCGCGN